jgi:hypothetical protein
VQARDRGRREQPPTAGHRPGRGLEGEHHTEQIHPEDASPRLGPAVDERLHQRDARVRDADVELGGLAEGGGDLVGVAHVRHDSGVIRRRVHADDVRALE